MSEFELPIGEGPHRRWRDPLRSFWERVAGEICLAATNLRPAGCIVEVEFPDETIAYLQSGETVNVLMTAMNNHSVKADLSLKGFGPAYKRLLALVAG